MAVYHTAYLFRRSVFVEQFTPYLNASQNAESYQRLRSRVIYLLETNPVVVQLAGEYGGWDAKGFSEVTNNPIYTNADIGFCFVFLLYSSLWGTNSVELGLGEYNNIVLLRNLLLAHKWSKNDVNLLIDADRFQHFPTEFESTHGSSLYFGQTYGQYIRTGSTSAQLGWLDVLRARPLLEKLKQSRPRTLFERSLDRDFEDIQTVIHRAQEMLNYAVQHDTDLCIVISG